MQNRLLLAVFGICLFLSACNKMQEVPKTKVSASDSINPDALVPTPAGPMPRSHIHLIEKGYALMRKDGHMYKVERASRNIIEDYGKIDSATSTTSTSTITATASTNKTAAGSVLRPLPGYEATTWVTDAELQNTSAGSITSFSTNWVVPNIPASNDNQVLYIWDGLENSTQSDVIQPVLQWGNGAVANTSGGWLIANFYVWGPSPGQSAISESIPVSPGTILEGIITYNGQQSDGSYNYTSSFTDLSSGQPFDNSLTVIGGEQYGPVVSPPVPESVLAFEALEAYTAVNDVITYGVTQPSDYPAYQNYVMFYDPAVAINGTSAVANWTAQDYDTQWGESTRIACPPPANATGLTNYLYWHPVPTIDNTTGVKLTNTSTAYTINTTPGATVTLQLTAYTIRPGGIKGDQIVGTTTDYLTINTPGVTFNNGSTSISVSNSIAYYSFTMPASGTITVTGYFTPGPSEPPYINEEGIITY